MSLSSGSGRVNLGGGGSSCGESGLAATKVTPQSLLSLLYSLWAQPETLQLSPHRGERVGGGAPLGGKEASAKQLNLEAPGFKAEA